MARTFEYRAFVQVEANSEPEARGLAEFPASEAIECIDEIEHAMEANPANDERTLDLISGAMAKYRMATGTRRPGGKITLSLDDGPADDVTDE